MEATLSEQGSIAATSLPDATATISSLQNGETHHDNQLNRPSSFPSPLSAAHNDNETESAALDQHLRGITPETILKV
jgi:hypothetical protein